MPDSPAAVNFDLSAALRDAEEEYAAENLRSAGVYDLACRGMPGGNTRTVLFYPPFPLSIARGADCYLWDADGHRYIDFVVEQTAGMYGHSHPAIRDAITRAMLDGITLGGPTPYEGQLADLLVQRFPALELVRFTNSGTESNLLAIGTARSVTGRAKVMAFQGCYHGSMLTFAGAGSPLNAPFPMVMAPYNDADAAVRLIEENAADLAAVIVEPMVGGGGCIPGEPAFLQALRDATAKHGVVLIFDEVMTSRLGPGGLQQELGITPDMMTLGKYVGGGLTFGAFGGRADIMARFDPRRPDAYPHAGTFNNNVLTMAAGAAGLTQAYTAERAVSLNASGDALRGRLNDVIAGHGATGQVTGRGSMMTIHLCEGPVVRPPDAARMSADARALLHIGMIQRGLYISRRGMIVLSLPMGDAELDALVEGFDDFLTTYGSVLH